MKISDYAKKVGVCYKTAWRWYRAGQISGYQMKTGTIIITELDKSEDKYPVSAKRRSTKDS